MSKIVVTCDSTCALARDEAEKIGLPILPLNVIIDGVEYHDGIDINLEQLCGKMRAGANIKTSTPTPYEIGLFFDKVFADGADKIVHFTISHKLSSMFDLFTNYCNENYGDKVVVVDALAVCSFMLNHVLTAKNMIERGVSIEEALAAVEPRKQEVDFNFVPESLTFLKRGGRVSPAVALIGNLIGMTPVLRFVDGGLDKAGTTRNVKRTCVEILQGFAASGKDPEKFRIDIVYADTDPKLIEYVQGKIAEICPQYETFVTPLSINVVAHAGPGTIGVGLTLKPGK